MKALHKFMITAACIAFLSGCSKDYLDVNDNPNTATDENITPELIFPQAVHAAGTIQPGLAVLDNWMGYFASNGDYARDQIQTSYNIDFTFSNPFWFAYYNALYDLNRVKVKSMVEGGDTALAAAATIVSAMLFQNMVDIWNDIPYSQAFNNDEFQHPAYDDAKTIYKDLLAQLDTAVGYMKQPAALSFATADIIFHGDQIKWIKTANTIRLRILLRQSEIESSVPTEELNKIQQDGGVLGAGESFSVNPGYIDEVNKQNPTYASIGYTPQGVRATASANANSYIIDILQSSEDPRIGRFFTSVSGSYIGNGYGDDPGNLYPGNQASYFGPGLVGSAGEDQWLITSFVSLFLKAEAVARHWLPGDAKTAYEDAVKESFAWLKVPNAESEAQAYLQDAAIANWANAGSSVSSQVKFIAYQKYIAMCGIDPLEAWCDLRRLNFLPDKGYISLNPSKISNTLPVRLLYPQTEYTTNGASVKAEGDINQFSSKIFWQP